MTGKPTSLHSAQINKKIYHNITKSALVQPMNKMGNYKDFYVTPEYKNPSGELDTLLQMLRITWDGDIISKDYRDNWIRKGYAKRIDGFSIITIDGIRYLKSLGAINS